MIKTQNNVQREGKKRLTRLTRWRVDSQPHAQMPTLDHVSSGRKMGGCAADVNITYTHTH